MKSSDQAAVPNQPAAQRSMRRYLPLALLLAAMIFAFQQGWHNHLSFATLVEQRDALNAYVRDFGILAVVAYFIVYALIVALSVPGASFMTLVGGLLFGWLVGGIVTVLAATAGATIIFLIAKSSLGVGLAKRAGAFAARMADGFRRNAMNYLLFLRLVPVFPFWLVNLAPAVLGVPLTTYVIGTMLGIVPGTFAFTFVGAGLNSVIDAQIEARSQCLAQPGAKAETCPYSFDIATVITPELLIALTLLGVVALIPIMVQRYAKDDKSAS